MESAVARVIDPHLQFELSLPSHSGERAPAHYTDAQGRQAAMSWRRWATKRHVVAKLGGLSSRAWGHGRCKRRVTGARRGPDRAGRTAAGSKIGQGRHGGENEGRQSPHPGPSHVLPMAAFFQLGPRQPAIPPPRGLQRPLVLARQFSLLHCSLVSRNSEGSNLSTHRPPGNPPPRHSAEARLRPGILVESFGSWKKGAKRFARGWLFRFLDETDLVAIRIVDVELSRTPGLIDGTFVHVLWFGGIPGCS